MTPCTTCGGEGVVERLATPEEVDNGCELGVAFDVCPDCVRVNMCQTDAGTPEARAALRDITVAAVRHARRLDGEGNETVTTCIRCEQDFRVYGEVDGVPYGANEDPCLRAPDQGTHEGTMSVRRGFSLHKAGCPRAHPSPLLPAEVVCTCGDGEGTQ